MGTSNTIELEDRLIWQVYECPAIWDLFDSQHKNTYITTKEWAKIANNLGITSKKAQNIWDRLRTTFKTELKNIPVPRSGAEGTHYQSSWPHFQSLQFLMKSVQPKPSTGNLPAIVTAEYKSSRESESHSTDKLPSHSIAASKSNLNASKKYQQMLTITNKDCSDNSDWYFFLSILPVMGKMKLWTQKLQFRMEVTHLLNEYLTSKELSEYEDYDCDDVQVVDFRMKRK